MATSALSLVPSTITAAPLTQSRARLQTKARLIQLTAGSAYRIYVNSLAPSGRRAMVTLLDQCVLLLGHQGPAEQFNWDQLTFEKAHLIRSSLVELGYAVSTTNMMLAALRGVTKAAFNLGHMDADTMLRINSVKSLKGNAVRTGRRLSTEDTQKLLASCEDLSCPAKRDRDKAILLIGIGAGLRCTEICSLNRDDLDEEQGLLRVREGKGRKQRQIYLAETVQSALKAWLQHRGSAPGAVFTRILKSSVVTEDKLTSNGLSHALKNLQQQANISAFTPHDLRRTFITRLLEEGIDLNTVRQLAGHSDVSTTVRYDKRDLEWQKSASQSMVL